MCPTANAAYIVGGKTIESALQLEGTNYSYKKLSADRETDLKFKYEDVSTIFIDEISMVGSGKLAKINYRLQDLADGKDKKKFMGGKSSIVTGDWFQLPPVKDKYIFSNTCLDDRPKIAPSHWDENYKIAFLREKMRSKGDNEFGELCDRIARNELTDQDEKTLESFVRDSPNENNNEMYQSGDIGILVTTNEKREKINQEKLNNLLPSEDIVSNYCKDKCTNIIDAPLPPENMNYTKARGLPFKLHLKVGAPILITVNDIKYKEDGIVNGAKGYIDSFQFNEDDPEKVKAIWVVFRDETVGRRLRMDKYELKAMHTPANEMAVPIELTKTRFEIDKGNHKYVRQQFPVVLAYAVTTHKSQGDSMVEVIVDFESGENKRRPFIIPGLFYVAITRATKAENVYLKNFKRSYIRVDPNVPKKLDDMCITKPYTFYKVYNEDDVFEHKGKEIKIGYLNINGVIDSNHSEYLNDDRNLLELDILVISETKLTSKTCDEYLMNQLHAFNILQRMDAEDEMKHMGFLILSPKGKENNFVDPALTRQFKDSRCQIIVQKLDEPINKTIAFVYMRPSTSSETQINKILQEYQCERCEIIMGDMNLNPREKSDMDRLEQLCQNRKEIALQETTTRQKNQLDHILVDKKLNVNVFVTSFVNFISDHKTIVIRYGIENNTIKKELIQRSTQRSQNYIKRRISDLPMIKHVKKEEDTASNGDSMSLNDETHIPDLVKIEDSKEQNVDLNVPDNSQSILACLEGHAWLTGDLINAYSSLLTASTEEAFVFSTYFSQTLEADPIRAKRQTGNTNLFNKRVILFPIHGESHWYLIRVNDEANTIESLDPYVYQTKKQAQAARNKQKLKRQEIQRFLTSLNEYPKGKKYKHIRNGNIPEQTNTWDCGVFMLMFMKYTVAQAEFEFEQEDMQVFRKNIQDELEINSLVLPRRSRQPEPQKEQNALNCDIPNSNIPPKFSNPSATICWLNSIIQLLLTTFKGDHLNSTLGRLMDAFSKS